MDEERLSRIEQKIDTLLTRFTEMHLCLIEQDERQRNRAIRTHTPFPFHPEKSTQSTATSSASLPIKIFRGN